VTTFDYSDISKLAADLGEAPAKVRGNVRKALEVTARHVRDDWRAPLEQSETIPRGAFTVSYDISSDNSRTADITAEIGPTVRGKGSHWVGGLIGALEYGTPTTPPTGYGHAALQKNQDDFEKGLRIAAGDIL
jgi:hypothetical protein